MKQGLKGQAVSLISKREKDRQSSKHKVFFKMMQQSSKIKLYIYMYFTRLNNKWIFQSWNKSSLKQIIFFFLLRSETNKFVLWQIKRSGKKNPERLKCVLNFQENFFSVVQMVRAFCKENLEIVSSKQYKKIHSASICCHARCVT